MSSPAGRRRPGQMPSKTGHSRPRGPDLIHRRAACSTGSLTPMWSPGHRPAETGTPSISFPEGRLRRVCRSVPARSSLTACSSERSVSPWSSLRLCGRLAWYSLILLMFLSPSAARASRGRRSPSTPRAETSFRGGGPFCGDGDVFHFRDHHQLMMTEPIVVLSLYEGIMIAYWREL